jgi:hypothetical protein
VKALRLGHRSNVRIDAAPRREKEVRERAPAVHEAEQVDAARNRAETRTPTPSSVDSREHTPAAVLISSCDAAPGDDDLLHLATVPPLAEQRGVVLQPVLRPPDPKEAARRDRLGVVVALAHQRRAEPRRAVRDAQHKEAFRFRGAPALAETPSRSAAEVAPKRAKYPPDERAARCVR